MIRRHVVLVGLPGAGKTSAGRMAAAALGAAFHDTDRLAEERFGCPIPAIFAAHGEAAFRAAERELVSAALEGPASLIAPGAGWAAQPGRLAETRNHAVFLYLEVHPETAARRAHAAGRPLLGAGDPGTTLERMRDLFRVRAPLYEQADVRIAADDLDVAGLAAAVAAAARDRAGWA